MKITRLEIKEYKQFKDLTLDLTYPLGHPKAGEPLDKICIIGQSGVGKTNLLNIIEKSVIYFYNKPYKNYFKEIDFNGKNVNNKYISNKLLTQNNLSLSGHFEEEYTEINRWNDTGKIDINLFNDDRIIFNQNEKVYFFKLNEFLIDNKDGNSWKILEQIILNYNNERLKYMDRLSNKLLNLDDYTKEDFKEEMQEWEEKNKNILEKISIPLNKILNKFNLTLTKIDENQKSYNDLIFKDLSNGKIIEYENLSTGTKNIISTFIPLKIHNRKDSIILIDEPENSFYPDIQRKLTELYMEVGENNQLIMATHSPLIASSFEPWEVVELKFDENTHQIYRELYYDSENDERHIDNYTLDPQLLTWTGILMDIFDMKESSNSNLREQKLIEFNILKEEIKNIENLEEKEKLFKKLQNMGKKLGIYNQ